MLDFGHFVEINITLLLEPSRAEDDNELANSPILVHSLIPGETVGADVSCTAPMYRPLFSSTNFLNAPIWAALVNSSPSQSCIC